MYVVQRIHFSGSFINSEAVASEFSVNFEKCFPVKMIEVDPKDWLFEHCHNNRPSPEGHLTVTCNVVTITMHSFSMTH